MSSERPIVDLLIVDLDNTLWDWVDIWGKSFGAMLRQLTLENEVDPEILKREIQAVHQQRNTVEYSFLLDELPSLANINSKVIESAKYAQSSTRFHLMKLYPHVLSTLAKIKSSGTMVIAYTEGIAFWSEWRIRKSGLDGVIDYLYSSPDHDFPIGLTPESVRTKPADSYGLRKTVHQEVAKGVVKPSPAVLEQIIYEHGYTKHRCAYVGDSLAKDIKMAQDAGVMDVYAEYGQPKRESPEYSLLLDVTQWDKATIGSEVASGISATPQFTLERSFSEILGIFEFAGQR